MSHCEFCGKVSTLQCDGPLIDGKPVSMEKAVGKHRTTCHAHVCRRCARKIGDAHIRGSWTSIDLCPLCQKAQEA